MLNHVEIKGLRPFQAATISGDPLCAARGAIRGALRALGPVAWKSWFHGRFLTCSMVLIGDLYGIIWDYMGLYGIIWNYIGLYGIIWDYMEL